MDESLTLARLLTGAAEDDGLLALLCRTAEDTLRGRLLPDVTAADCGETCFAAAALLATADWREVRQEDGISFRAGEVSVTAQPAEEQRSSAAGLRNMAWRMMEPYTADGGFCFRGV